MLSEIVIRLTKVTILPDVSSIFAVACDPILLDRAFTAVFASVWSFAWVHELTIIQSDLSDHSLGIDHVSRFNSLIVHSYFTHAPH